MDNRAAVLESALADILEAGRAAIPDDASPQEEANAVNHLLGLLSAGIDLLAQRADPTAPLLTGWMTETRKMFGDSPDTVYTTAPVDCRFRYRLRIRPGNGVYWGLVVYARDANGAVRVAGSLNDAGFAAATDGTYTVTLGGPSAGDGWLPLEDGAFWLMVREYFCGADRQPGRLQIERLDGPPGESDPAAGWSAVADVARWVKAVSVAEKWLFDLSAEHYNRTPAPAGGPIPDELVQTFLPTPDNEYQGCVWQLGADEALVVRFIAPPARHWSVTAMNRWLESLDARRGRNCINACDVVVGPDGAVEVIVSERDPGQPNWLPTQGHRTGMLAFRTLLPEGPPVELNYTVRSSHL